MTPESPEGAAPMRVLVADDNADILHMFEAVLARRGDHVTTASSGEAAVARLAEEAFDLVLTDLKMGGATGLDVLEAARAQGPGTAVVIMTGYASLDTALAAIRGGAYDYITKPFTLDEIEVLLDHVAERIRMRRENDLLVRELADAYGLIAELQAAVPEGAAPASDADPEQKPDGHFSAVPAREGLDAYRAAVWTPRRSADRLRLLRDQGALSQEAYDRLAALIPQGFPVA